MIAGLMPYTATEDSGIRADILALERELLGEILGGARNVRAH
jgi:hypothetical protein